MLRGMSSPAAGPINKNNIYGNLGPNLSWVNEKLMINRYVRRDFSLIPPIYQQQSPPSPQTPPFPHPMHPLEYWQTWARSKRETYIWMISRNSGISKIDDHRSSIDDAHYWRCEAVFWFSKSNMRRISAAKFQTQITGGARLIFGETTGL
ncbi:predicted protein [Histoplasma capsulatum var. duboisii H88]|uniref:Predicted protein n=2 Tax=Ajellomyces capsulatus TaxID=5037 RepID=F0UVZ1_AJEC8|nr:predicted protein [Histoplasma capsulatum H143]EGC42501.1 predicted protein [Histoplasma capsulatum var. duboisii H88]QSS57460.1 hypothetical protein I7I53_11644 [Histoplasma capsulatum var. duboisii H88]